MRARPCTPEQAAHYLRPVLGRKANPLAECGMQELVDGRCYQVIDDGGQQVGVYVLRGQGSEVWVQAAAGSAECDLSHVFDDLIELHGAGFESIAFRTYRLGLVRKALKRGYEIVDETRGYTMRKRLK